MKVKQNSISQHQHQTYQWKNYLFICHRKLRTEKKKTYPLILDLIFDNSDGFGYKFKRKLTINNQTTNEKKAVLVKEVEQTKQCDRVCLVAVQATPQSAALSLFSKRSN